MNSVATCTPCGRGRCPMAVARSQVPEDYTRIQRWRTGAKHLTLGLWVGPTPYYGPRLKPSYSNPGHWHSRFGPAATKVACIWVRRPDKCRRTQRHSRGRSLATTPRLPCLAYSCKVVGAVCLHSLWAAVISIYIHTYGVKQRTLSNSHTLITWHHAVAWARQFSEGSQKRC